MGADHAHGMRKSSAFSR